MKVLAFISAMLLFVLGSGCTRNLYDGLRFRQEMDCQNTQGADRDACFKRSGMSYDEYQQQLKEQEQKK